MDTINKYVAQYKQPLATGALSVVLGFAAKKFMKCDNISTGSLKQAGMSFVLVSLAGVAAQEVIKDKYV